MTKKEAAMLLDLIKLSYPSSYRGMDDQWQLATINMWQMSFPDVPYPIMEQAFNQFRMISKFPPTVAEMVAELKNIYNQALENALVCKSIGNEELSRQYRAIMDATARYRNEDHIRELQICSLPKMLTGGDFNGQFG